ncbi:zinc finger protein 771-like [Mya arenaria]|uniref:zinc finger protein 771-like n=1 Tax=Mya arenaria TaxID=6604 RepID=UPI0022DF6ABE|nr:zinc finger protein 771-like [Mya arenaria]XP_052809033.1 zinc finger protein 771-like [Mya arenaria]XP_052809034.1 zinc finger protein 771-like [Mya arenaria]XP_052809035.1 zinc finger protein 771-like [Mya arenaria]
MASRKAPIDMYTVSQVPGYKTVMRAVLKAQIHHLIVQLSEIGGEDSVLLTASVENGTLTHLGSDVAESFLKDHDNFRTEFLDHCIRSKEWKPLTGLYSNKKKQDFEMKSPSLFVPKSKTSPRRGKRSAPYSFNMDGTQGVSPVRQSKRPQTSRTGIGQRNVTTSKSDNENQDHTFDEADDIQIVKEIKEENFEGSDDVVDKKQTEMVNDEMEGDSDADYNVGDDENGELNAEMGVIGSELSIDTTNYQADPDDDGEYVDTRTVSKCHVCEDEFYSQAELKRHFVEHHPDSKPYKCGVCEKCLGTKRDLGRHMRTHTGERPFQCATCGKAFILGRHLKDHELIHTGSKPFKCSVCKRSFRNKYTLKMHFFIHTGERQFMCMVCGQRFKSRGCLKSHALTHTDIKPFVCEICERPFRRKSQMRQHQHTHAKASHAAVVEQVIVEEVVFHGDLPVEVSTENENEDI